MKYGTTQNEFCALSTLSEIHLILYTFHGKQFFNYVRTFQKYLSYINKRV